MKNTFINFILAISIVFTTNVFAMELETLKEKKHVGENNSGYLVPLVKNKEIINYVESINNKRKNIYLKSAEKLNISLEMFEQRVAQKIESESKKGYIIENEFGEWVEK